MANLCPLLIHTSFIGRNYHDFRLNFQSLPENCSFDPLLIQFTRLINSTFNRTSYTLYNPTQSNHDYSPTLQIFPNDHVNLCIQSALNTDQIDRTCHEFYMITILLSSSINSNIWPLLIIFAYLLILLMGILTSKFFHRFSRTICSGLITKKILKDRVRSPYLNPLGRKSRSTEKREILRAIQSIAQDCQFSRKTKTFIIPTNNKKGHINRAYI